MRIRNVFLGALTGVTAVVGLAAPASAWVACNPEGDCWHTDTRYAAPDVRFEYHPDDWYFHRHWDSGRWRWREYHEGRGYWRNGAWITF